MIEGLTTAQAAAMLGYAIEAAMLRASARALKANAEEVLRVLPRSAVGAELDDLGELLGAAAEAPSLQQPPTGPNLRLVR